MRRQVLAASTCRKYSLDRARWIHRHFPESAGAIAIEWEKFWMDEWSGQENRAQLEYIKAALAHSVPQVLAALNEVT